MKEEIKKKLALFKSGKLSEKEMLRWLSHFPYHSMDNIKLDFHRPMRRGLPEVIYGRGKSTDQLNTIIQKFQDMDMDILITGISEEKFKPLGKKYPQLMYHSKPRIVTFDREPKVKFKGPILVMSAGSSDESVAEEAYISAKYLGNNVDREYDIGVACINRVLDLTPRLNRYNVLIVIAGMEGALPSVVAGLTSTPVIAVPTSVGYGANLNGIAALLSMLNSCSGGVSVVNIDNGFGAAFQATLINQKISD